VWRFDHRNITDLRHALSNTILGSRRHLHHICRTTTEISSHQQALLCSMSTGPDPFDAKYAPGAEQARQNVMVGVSVVMTSLGGKTLRSCRVVGYQLTSQVTCVILRVYTRGCIVKNMGREDWTMIAAAVCSIEIFTIDITDQPLDIDHRLLTGADCRSCRVQTWL
jgi:hypothetical protein